MLATETGDSQILVTKQNEELLLASNPPQGDMSRGMSLLHEVSQGPRPCPPGFPFHWQKGEQGPHVRSSYEPGPGRDRGHLVHIPLARI